MTEQTLQYVKASSPEADCIRIEETRHDWTLFEVAEVYNKPLIHLVLSAAKVHESRQEFGRVQKCTLLSIKTGGCPEDCAYCPQSARYKTDVQASSLLSVEAVINAAAAAKLAGSTRFCMGAAWREIKDDSDFERVLSMVRAVSSTGMEVCCTLGMLDRNQAIQLKQAGLTAYNHNIDTSERFYNEIITTRTYADRLNTLSVVRESGLNVCCGGIVGMGETAEDRIAMLHTLCTLPSHPESVPINALVPVEGTPLANSPKVEFWTLLRTIATARILMPLSMVRLSAGRLELSQAEQALCFLAGANSIFAGDKLLTTTNCTESEDEMLFSKLGLAAIEHCSV